MKCPVCKTIDLSISDRSGIEIDYCPQCRGVWLDRGELDKIIERAEIMMPARRTQPPTRPVESSPAYYDDDDDYRGDYRDPIYGDDKNSQYPHKKKRKSFFGEIFDIFD